MGRVCDYLIVRAVNYCVCEDGADPQSSALGAKSARPLFAAIFISGLKYAIICGSARGDILRKRDSVES